MPSKPLARLLRLALPIGLATALLLTFFSVLPAAHAAAQVVAPRTVPLAGEVCFATLNSGGFVYSSTDASAVRNAVAAAAPGASVKIAGICAGVAAQGGTTQTVLITKTLTLVGGYTTTNWTTSYPLTRPTTLDAQGGGRVVHATANLTVSNLTVQNGNGGGNNAGGGVNVTSGGSSLVLSHVVVQTNTAPNSGGGVFVANGGELTIRNSQFIANTSAGFFGGGGVYFQNTSPTRTLTITGTTFMGNSVTNGSSAGGGALVSEANANIANSTFLSNTVQNGSGGGVLIRSSRAVTVTNSVFTNNRSVNSNGGGLSALGPSVISNTTFTGNTAVNGGGASFITTTQLVNGLLAANAASTNGAAIYVANAAPLNLIHTTIVSPTAPTGAPQAVYVAAGTVYVTNTLIASHTVGIERAGGTVNENYNLFSDVTTPYSGTVLSGGNSLTGTAAFFDTTGYTLTASSAAIDRGTNTGVTSDYFGNPRPQGSGYDIGYAESPYTVQCYATPNSGTNVYTSANAQAVRDAVAAANSGDMVKIAGYCAGVAAQGGTTQTVLITQSLTLAGGYTLTNWVTSYPLTQPTTLDALGGGRVILVNVGATLQGFTVTNGTISGNGGGLYAAGGITLTDMTFYSNTTSSGFPRHGGGGFIGGAATVTGGTFQSNRATSFGGGLYVSGTLSLTGTQFLSNTGSVGGGLYTLGAAEVTNTLFAGNTATSNGSGGGGLYAGNLVTLRNTQFQGNTAFQGGGLNVNSGGFATLSGVAFISNTVSNIGGGAIFNGSASVTDTTFAGNRAPSNVGGGAAFRSSAYITNTVFSDNFASAGGGASFSGNQHQVTNVLFARNRATSNGAAIWNANTLHLRHITIVSPTVPSGAPAAVYVSGGTVYITNSVVASATVGIRRNGGTVVEDYNLFDNVATPYSGTITSGGNSLTSTAAFYDTTYYTLTASSAAIDAGTNAGVTSDYFGNPRPQGVGYDIGYFEAPPLACYATSNDGVTLYGSNDAQAVRDAVATAGSGSTVKIAGTCAGVAVQSGTTQTVRITQSVTLVGGYAPNDWQNTYPLTRPTVLDAQSGGRVVHATANLTMSNLTVQNGNGGGNNAGGGVNVTSGGSSLVLSHVVVQTNTSPSSGGGVFVANGGELTISNSQFIANTSAGFFGGGGVYFQNTSPTRTLTITGTTFMGNSVTNGSSAGGGALVSEANANIANSTFLSNTVQNGSGGGVLIRSSRAVTVTNSVFTNNRSVNSNGGGLSALGPSVISNTTFTGNTAVNGGGVYLTSTATLTTTTFTSNTATLGGGLYAGGSLTLTNSLLTHNLAQVGGGLYAAASGGGTFISNTQIISNAVLYFTGNSGGGGFYASQPITLSHSLISENTAWNHGAGGWVGNNPHFFIENSDFISNTGGGEGGALLVKPNSQGEIRSSRLLSNTADYAGGVYIETNNTVVITDTEVAYNQGTGDYSGGIYVNASSTLTVSHSRIHHNTVSTTGGGINVESSNLTLVNSEVTDNSAVQGGGVFMTSGSYAWVQNSLISRNWASSDGGGLYSDSDNPLTVTNSLFAGNVASSTRGMAFYLSSNGQIQILHTTIASATLASGSAIYVGNFVNTVYLTNTIIASHTVGLKNGNGIVTEDYNLFSGVTTPYSGTVVSGGNSLTSTAAFYDTTYYTLNASSAAIDRGTNAGVTSDYFGDPRPQGLGYDIGYDEAPFTFYTLTVTTAGNGSGIVTPTVGVYTYTYGTVVTLTASANVGSTFTGWGGDCSGTGSCVVMMTGHQNVTANFTLIEYKRYLPFVVR